MTHAWKINKVCVRNAPGEILCVLALDEFIILAVDDRDRHADPCQVICRVIGLRSLHECDCFRKFFKLIWRGRELVVVLYMPAEASLDEGTELEFLCATRIHVAREEKYASSPCGCLIGKDQSCAGAIAPTGESGLLDMQCIHHRQDVGCHQLI